MSASGFDFVWGVLLGGIGGGVLGVVLSGLFWQQISARLDQILRETLARLDKQTQSFDEARLMQHVQQAMRVELEYLSQRQLDRDEAFMQERRMWEAEQDARRTEDTDVVLQALGIRLNRTKMHSVANKPETPPRTASADTLRTAPILATHTSKAAPPQPLGMPETEQLGRQFTDAEIDALPPELPQSSKKRNRILATAPKTPPLRSI